MRFQDSRPDHWAHRNNSPKPHVPACAEFSAWRFLAAAIGLTLVIAAVVFIVAAVAANAHDWYPMECCSGQDCAPVDKAESSMPPMSVIPGAAGLAPVAPELPSLVVTTRHGSGVVPPDMPRRRSPDGRMHACVRQGTVLCIFVPDGM